MNELEPFAYDHVTPRGSKPPWRLSEYRAHDPLPHLGAIQRPVLAITGDKDIQVNPDELTRTVGSVRGPSTTLRPTDLTRVLRTSTRKPSITHYTRLLREPVNAELVESVVSWAVDGADPTR